MKIILDTNFLIYSAKQKIDYVKQIRDLVKGKYELVVLNQVKEELRNLAKKAKKYSERQAAELALKLLKINKVKTIKARAKNADESIIKQAKDNIVATLDLELAKKLGRVIIIRGKQRLSFR